MADENRIMRQVMRDHLKRAERAVALAKRRRDKAEEATQRAWDKRNEADDALSAAEYHLSLVRMDQANWRANEGKGKR